MGKIIAVLGTIITVVCFFVLSIYNGGSDYSSGLGTVSWLIMDIGAIFEGTIQWNLLISEIVLLLGVVFMIIGIWKRTLGIIGSIIVLGFTIFALLGVLGIAIPLEFNILWNAMYPNEALIAGILPFHLEIVGGYGLGAIVVPVGAIVTIVGQILNKKKK